MSYTHLLFVIIYVMFLVIIPLVANAQFAIDDPLGNRTISDIIVAVSAALRPIALAIGTVMIIVSGIQYLVSAGDAEKATKAKKTLLYTVIGLVIVVSATFIIEAVQEILTTEVIIDTTPIEPPPPHNIPPLF